MSYIRNILMSSVANFAPEGEAGQKSAKDLQREQIEVTNNNEPATGDEDKGEEKEAEGETEDDKGTEEDKETEEETVEGDEESEEKVEETEAELKEKKKQDRIERKFAKERQEKKELAQKVAELEAKLAAEGKDTLSAEDIQKQAETIAQQQIAQRDFVNACNKLAAEATKINKDFSVKIKAVSEDVAPIPHVMIGILEDLDNGGAVLNHLANNEDDYEEIISLSPAKMAVKLAKLSVEIIPKPKPKPISKVPEPNTPIGGNTRSPNVLSDKDSVDDWVAKRNQQVAERRAQGRYNLK